MFQRGRAGVIFVSLSRMNVLLLLLALLTAATVSAQPPRDSSRVAFDEDLSVFKEKQDALMDLLARQKPFIEQLQKQITENKQELQVMSDLLKSPKNIPKYRESATRQLVDLRKRNDDCRRRMQGLFFEWVPSMRDLLAIYTRFGELAMVDKTTDDLKLFLGAYRSYTVTMEKMSKQVEDIYNECDFLLNSKLE